MSSIESTSKTDSNISDDRLSQLVKSHVDSFLGSKEGIDMVFSITNGLLQTKEFDFSESSP